MYVRLLFFALVSICTVSQDALSVLRVHFISVGHGDAILIEEEGKGIALVDAGKPEAGSIVLAYLREEGISNIDHLFVTHTHDDHVGGVPLILDSLNVGIIHHTGMVHGWETARKFNDYLEKGLWLSEVNGAGDVPVQSGDLKIEVLSPVKEETEGLDVDPNPNSMVLLVTHGKVKILLTADIYREREAWLIETYGYLLESQVMKASHHASANGNSAVFLQTVKPKIVAVTLGPNEWGYPSPETMIRLQQHCPVVLRTDDAGSIVIESDGDTCRVTKPEKMQR